MNPYHLYAAALLVGLAIVLGCATVASAIDRYRLSWQPIDPLQGTQVLDDPAFDVIEEPDDTMAFREAA